MILALACQSPAAFAQTRGEGPLPFDSEIDVPARNTIIEFTSVQGAVKYQVEIRSYSRYWAHNYGFEIPGDNPKLRIRLNPGRYGLRTRAFDAEGFYGPWSRWQPFWIHYTESNGVYPADGAVVKPKSGVRELIQFEWPVDKQALGYLFVLRDAEQKVIYKETVRTPWKLVEVELSSSYSWTYVPLKTASDYKEKNPEPRPEHPYYSFRVQGPAPGTKDMQVSATPSPRAVKYQFEFLKLDRLGERGSSSVFESPVPDFKIAIAPGTYEARVRTFFSDKSVSDWSPPWQFFVPYEKVRPISPTDGEEIDPIDFDQKVTFKWHPQQDVTFYKVYVYEPDGTFVKAFESEKPEVEGTLEHDKLYRWLVIPYSANQSDIKPPEMPDYATRVKIKKYIPLLMADSEEPSHIYAWGRYYTSMIDYEGRNYDLNSKVSQPIYGGTGELALGYWHRKSRLGLLAHGGLSGFAIGENVYNYANAGLHLGYRHFTADGRRLRIWLGWSYQEFPEFLRDPFIKNYDYHRVKTGGPQLQVSYMGDFERWPKYGWHVYGTVFRGQQGIETPNGLDPVPQFSFTLGAFGTYKWTDDQKWMLGYAYRQENIRYKSNDRTGLDNYSFTSGHYLNLSIEWGLSKQKYK